MCGLDMVLKLFAFHPGAVLQRITFWAFYTWDLCCCLQRSFYFLMRTVMWSFHAKIKKSPFSSIFMVLLIPCEITVYATYFTNHDAPSSSLFSDGFDHFCEFFQTTGLLQQRSDNQSIGSGLDQGAGCFCRSNTSTNHDKSVKDCSDGLDHLWGDVLLRSGSRF